MTCDTCRWFKRDWVREDAKSEYGHCIRHAPVTGVMAGTHVTLFPRVGESDRCGDYEPVSVAVMMPPPWMTDTPA